MGVVKYFQGFYEEAIHYLSSAIKYKKNNSDYYFWRALSYGRKNDNLRAIIDYRKSLSLNANNASCIHNYAKALGREGEWQSAFKQVERAIKIRPEDTDILVTKGFIEFKLDQLEAADHTFKEILKSHPQHYEAMYFRGFTNLKQKISRLAGNYLIIVGIAHHSYRRDIILRQQNGMVPPVERSY